MEYEWSVKLTLKVFYSYFLSTEDLLFWHM